MIQRIVILVLCAVLSSPAVAAEPLVIAVSRSPLSLPLFVAEHQGYFVAEGVQVRFEEVLGGHRAMQALLEGKADLATVSETVAMFASFQRKDFAILASFVSSNDDIKLLTRAGSGIATASDLAGKRVGTVPGSASHYYLDTLLLLSGVAPERVRIVGLQPEAMAQALQNGEVAAVAVWEPYPFNMLAGVRDARIVPARRFHTLTFNLAASRKAIDGGREDDLVRLLRALERAEKFIASEPGKAQDILKSCLGLEQAFVAWIWPGYNYRLSLDQSLLPTLESEARWARRQGHVKAAGSPNYLEFIHAAPLRAVSPANVNMVE
jgi:ABC-type nitrate/sulfonate/bicarbonate transport system substrate-binding protein